jgi:hypothetical protein
MPIHYVVLHLALSAGLGTAAYRLAARPRHGALNVALAAAMVAVVGAGFPAERRPAWMAAVTLLGLPDVVFFTNLSLEGIAVVLGLLWRQAQKHGGRGDRLRAGVLSVVALSAACYSYAWLFQPVPTGLAGTIGEKELCRQSTPSSCSAAAAVTLLHAYTIETDEAEMASLCLTRDRLGTATLGLYRGLALKTRERGLHPVIRHVCRPESEEAVRRLAELRSPAILSVGLAGNPPEEVRQKLEGYGWQEGVRHAVVMMGADPKAGTLDIADPSFGRETWPVKNPEDLAYIWDGWAIVLPRR